MASESENLVVAFFHAMRSEAKQARRKPEPRQQAPLPKPVFHDEWWVPTPLQLRAMREMNAREMAREDRARRHLDRHADARAWERQFD